MTNNTEVGCVWKLKRRRQLEGFVGPVIISQIFNADQAVQIVDCNGQTRTIKRRELSKTHKYAGRVERWPAQLNAPDAITEALR